MNIFLSLFFLCSISIQAVDKTIWRKGDKNQQLSYIMHVQNKQHIFIVNDTQLLKIDTQTGKIIETVSFSSSIISILLDKEELYVITANHKLHHITANNKTEYSIPFVGKIYKENELFYIHAQPTSITCLKQINNKMEVIWHHQNRAQFKLTNTCMHIAKDYIITSKEQNTLCILHRYSGELLYTYAFPYSATFSIIQKDNDYYCLSDKQLLILNDQMHKTKTVQLSQIKQGLLYKNKLIMHNGQNIFIYDDKECTLLNIKDITKIQLLKLENDSLHIIDTKASFIYDLQSLTTTKLHNNTMKLTDTNLWLHGKFGWHGHNIAISTQHFTANV